MKPNRTLLQVALLMGWLAGQNVGIGTTTPLTRLHVAAGDLFLGEASGGTGFVFHSRAGNAYDFLQITSRTSGTWEWGKGITFVRSSGHVGIGTTTPTERLHVEGNLRLQGAFMPGNQAGTSGQVLLSQGAGVAPIWGWALTKNDVYVAYSSANVDLTGNQWRDIAGPITLNLPAGAKVIAYASGSAVPTGACYASADIRISVNGNDFPNGAYTGETVDYSGANWDYRESYSLMGVYDVPAAGTYTFRLQGWGPAAPSQTGCAVRVGGDSNMYTQAVLIIMVLR